MSAKGDIFPGLAVAAACTLTGSAACAGEDPIIWEQLPFGSVSSSSNTDCDEPFGSLADGFVGDGRDVVGLAWWGAIKSNAELTGFEIAFWSFADGCPDQLVDSQTFEVFTEYTGDPSNRYEVTLHQPFHADAGTPFAVSITALTCDPDDPFPFHFFWHLAEGDGTPLCVLANDGNPWTPSEFDSEAAFILFAEMPTTPVINCSWAEIKRGFRSP